jgi:hypothetical protein
MREFDACICGREPPVDDRIRVIASIFPCRHLADQALRIGDPPIQTLPPQNAGFDFGHIEPTAVLRRVMGR